MKLLYATDLHGVKWKYDKILQITAASNIDIVVNGGDMLPAKPSFFKQDAFIVDFLDEYFSKFNSKKIYYITMLGNDDLQIFDKLFHKICNKYPFVINIAQNHFTLGSYEFIGMNLVTDLPFGLKDRARIDGEGFKFPKQLGKQYLSSPEGLKRIEDWVSYAQTLPTIEEELNRLPKPRNMAKSIYIIHTSPSNLSLDMISNGRTVGSDSVYNFLKKNQPLLSLHGHIHESPDVSGKWCSKLEKTICIQPGQSAHYEDYLVYVMIDLKSLEIERFKVKK
jgi:Icc-related predicted phosphoesterase